MVTVLSVCLCVSIFSGKIKTLIFQTGYWQTSNYTRKKNNVGNFLKPFGAKVMTIFITHSYHFTTLRWNEGNNESKYGHTNTSDPVSWLLLAKKPFKPKTIEVIIGTPPLMHDRKLLSSTYRYLHVRAFLQSVMY